MRNGANTGKSFKILSLDGGGTFCLIQAKVLADLYPGQSGHEVLSHFDLVAACSGGSIVAACLVEGHSPSQILDLFLTRQNRVELFSSLPWYERLIRVASQCLSRNPFGPRFSTERKLGFLHRVLPTTGTIPLHEVGSHIDKNIHLARSRRGCDRRGIGFLVVTHDYDRNRARLLRSDSSSPAANVQNTNDEITLAEAVHASSTAPLNWFDRPVEINRRRYWDGAMAGYNNPVLAGVTEAIAGGQSSADIGVLAIGTSTVNLPQGPNKASADGASSAGGGFVGDLTKAAKLIISDPPDAHTFISHVVLNGGLPASAAQCPDTRTAVIRMNPVVQPVLDPAREGFLIPAGWSEEDFYRLANLDVATIEDDETHLITRLTDDWMQGRWYNQAIRSGSWQFDVMTGGKTLNGSMAPTLCEIGHHRYQEAKSAWLSM